MHLQLSDSSVVVVRGGGHGYKRRRSITSGGSVYHALRQDHSTHDLHVHADGTPMVGGRKVSMKKVLGSSATVFNCLHGKPAGRLAKACNKYQTAYTGNSHVHRARHHHTRPQGKHFRRHGIPTISHWILRREDAVENKKMNDAIAKQLSFPVVLYKLPDSFSRQQTVAEDRPELKDILDQVFSRQKRVFVQPAVSGKIFSAIAMPEFRSDSPYLFPRARLKHDESVANHMPEDRTYDHRGLRHDHSFYHFVRQAYQKADLHDLARIDVVKKRDGSLVLLDIEVHPRLDRHSLLAESAAKVGSLLKDIYKKQVSRAQR